MGDGIHKDILNILRYHIITPLQKSTGLGHVKQSYPCSWTRSPINALIVSCRLQQLNDVMIKGIVYKHLPAGLLHFQNLGALRDTLHTIALRILLTLEDFNFIMLLRITDFQAIMNGPADSPGAAVFLQSRKDFVLQSPETAVPASWLSRPR